MTDIVKGMARAYFDTHFADGWSYAEMEEKVPGHNADMEHSMRTALLWLADHFEQIADNTRMVKKPGGELVRTGVLISAAIRAAAGEEGK